MIYFFGKERLKTIGEMLIYFGTIFYGLGLIGDAAIPLKDNELFIHFFRETKNPLIGFLIGLIFAALVHASAIPIGILVSSSGNRDSLPLTTPSLSSWGQM